MTAERRGTAALRFLTRSRLETNTTDGFPRQRKAAEYRRAWEAAN